MMKGFMAYENMAEKDCAGYAVLVVSFRFSDVKRMKLLQIISIVMDGGSQIDELDSLIVGTDVG